ncbi:shikimate kinase [Myceligenerans salitolerans]|uniref:Shikimate kinase n=1 Tax=Myceligenerans salitolerans TaxID=1230528 RepID=A0ABS3IB02_9MICO|nr:shikimate kinase [Myceligenerans salitolerans]MBO0610134.1 shikimate kinase [Myceligenerans salitolerans]
MSHDANPGTTAGATGATGAPGIHAAAPAAPTGPPPDTSGPLVVLVGPPGSGKSKVGRVLAHGLGVSVRDTDHDIEERAGKPVADIFVDDGEPAFRAMEREAVAAALAEHDGILALGGGAVMDAATAQALTSYAARGGDVVFLDVTLAVAAPRVGMNQARPLLLGNPRQRWQALMDERRPTYERLATLRIHSTERPAEEAAAEIAGALGLRPVAEFADPRHLDDGDEHPAGKAPAARAVTNEQGDEQ